jgi:hypothetical protein
MTCSCGALVVRHLRGPKLKGGVNEIPGAANVGLDAVAGRGAAQLPLEE